MCLFLDAFKYILYWDTFQKKKKNNQLSVSMSTWRQTSLNFCLPSHFFHSVTPNLSFTGFNLHRVFSNLNAHLKTTAGKARL